MNTMNSVQMAAKLYQCRDSAKTLMGDKYKAEIAKFSELIAAQAKRDGCSELSAATDLAAKAGGFGAVYMLAAYVELVEPSEPPNVRVQPA
jgi:hypothetical protein